VANAELTTEPELTVRRFTIRSLRGGRQRLVGRAVLTGGAALEPLADGFTLAIEDGAGAVLYRAEVPAGSLASETRRNGTRVRLRGDVDSVLRRLRLDVREARTRVAFTLMGESLVPDGTRAITLEVQGANGCGNAKPLACASGAERSVSCAAAGAPGGRRRQR
jgi:hypothetical protein